jgi:hypothetical protein
MDRFVIACSTLGAVLCHNEARNSGHHRTPIKSFYRQVQANPSMILVQQHVDEVMCDSEQAERFAT